MLTKIGMVAPAILLLAVLVSACDARHTSPSAPTPVPLPAPSNEGALSGVWHLSTRLTTVSGGECVGEAMQSQIGATKPYTFAIKQNGSKLDMTLTSTSGDYACTYTGKTDSSGSTFSLDGYYWCEPGGMVRNFRCTNGMLRDWITLGQTLSGSVSDNGMSGTWRETRAIMVGGDDVGYLETTIQFTGSR